LSGFFRNCFFSLQGQFQPASNDKNPVKFLDGFTILLGHLGFSISLLLQRITNKITKKYCTEHIVGEARQPVASCQSVAGQEPPRQWGKSRAPTGAVPRAKASTSTLSYSLQKPLSPAPAPSETGLLG